MEIDQKKIAKMLGISQSTVSRALNGHPRVSDTQKERVQELCQRLGYVPNYSASSLSSRKTRTISVIINNPVHGIVVSDLHSRWVAHLQDSAQKRGYKLRMDYVGSYGTVVSERSADGLLVFGMPGSHGYPIVRDSCPLPAVFTDCVASDEPATVTIANAEGCAQAVRHLVELGHSSIAFFGHVSAPVDNNLCLERHRGYVTQMNNLGFPCPSAFTIEQEDWPYEAEDCYKYEGDIFKVIDAGATAFIASSDIAAIGLIKLLLRRGLSIPKDISVIGFDDSLLARMWEPPLTTVRQELAQASEMAVELLIRAVETGLPITESVVVPAPLMVRGTTAPPRR